MWVVFTDELQTAAMALSDDYISVCDKGLTREDKLCVIMGNKGWVKDNDI